MDRGNCQSCTIVGTEIYCDYYDAMYAKCTDIKQGNCPDGLDDEDDEDYHEICVECGEVEEKKIINAIDKVLLSFSVYCQDSPTESVKETRKGLSKQLFVTIKEKLLSKKNVVSDEEIRKAGLRATELIAHLKDQYGFNDVEEKEQEEINEVLGYEGNF